MENEKQGDKEGVMEVWGGTEGKERSQYKE